MAVRYVLTPIIGTGVMGDSYRPDLDGALIQGGRYFIASNVNGTPRFGWALCEIDAADWTGLDASTKVAALDALTDTTVLTTQQRTRLQAAITKLGVVVTVVNGDTFGGVLDRVLAASGWTGGRR